MAISQPITISLYNFTNPAPQTLVTAGLTIYGPTRQKWAVDQYCYPLTKSEDSKTAVTNQSMRGKLLSQVLHVMYL